MPGKSRRLSWRVYLLSPHCFLVVGSSNLLESVLYFSAGCMHQSQTVSKKHSGCARSNKSPLRYIAMSGCRVISLSKKHFGVCTFSGLVHGQHLWEFSFFSSINSGKSTCGNTRGNSPKNSLLRLVKASSINKLLHKWMWDK